MEPDTADVCAVIVTYHPQIELLQQVVRSVVDQVGRTLIFDNATHDIDLSSFLSIKKSADKRVDVYLSSSNVGLGTAINKATEYAANNGFRYLLVLDQDSLPQVDMVKTLRDALIEREKKEKVAAVGPQFFDRRNGYVAPFIKINFPVSTKNFGAPGKCVDSDFLISSGSLISLNAIRAIGGMDERLFIDNVDLEWCFRAKHKGYVLYGVSDAKMEHSIGDTLLNSWLKPSGMQVHKPIRLYYIMRNRVLLYGRKETPVLWIAQDFPRLIFKFFSTLMFLKSRRKYFQCMTRGMYDGVRGKSGPAPSM